MSGLDMVTSTNTPRSLGRENKRLKKLTQVASSFILGSPWKRNRDSDLFFPWLLHFIWVGHLLETAKHLPKQEILQRVKKMAVKNAYLNAFGKIGFLILGSGKVSPLIIERASDVDVELKKSELKAAFARDDVDAEYDGSLNPRETQMFD